MIWPLVRHQNNKQFRLSPKPDLSLLSLTTFPNKLFLKTTSQLCSQHTPYTNITCCSFVQVCVQLVASCYYGR